jgi:toxin ParE1/3/4
MPGTGEPYATTNRRLEGMRCSRVKRFRSFLIFYRPIAGGIEVIRVLHAARNIRAFFDTDAD